jgi:hypothetical protein
LTLFALAFGWLAAKDGDHHVSNRKLERVLGFATAFH